LLSALLRQFADGIATKGCRGDDIKGICFGVEHGEAVMMFGGNDDVLHPRRLGESYDVMGIEACGIELRGESLVVGYWNGSVVHDPFANSRDLLSVPGSCGDGVKTPVDEHAEACVPPPGHACVTLRGGLGILNRGHGMGGRNSDMMALELGS
jgi:hypothetical protein